MRPRSWTSAAVSSRSWSRRWCSDARLDRERRDGDGVLEQAAEVGVVLAARAGERAQRRAQRLVAEQADEQRAEAGLADLAGERVEEAVELVEVAVGDGQERRRVGRPGVDADEARQLDLQLAAEARDAPGGADEVAALEAPGEQVGVAEQARRAARRCGRAARRARYGDPGARHQPVLARAGEDAVERVAVAQRRDRARPGGVRSLRGRGGLGRRHAPMMYREPDAAAHLGEPSRRPPGPRTRVRVQRLERRRRGRLVGAARSSARARRDPLRAPRSRGVLRLPGHAADDQARRGRHPRRRVAGGRGLGRARPARAARPRARLGPRAVDALAHVLRRRSSSSPRRSACSSSSRSARCWPTSRTRAPSRSSASRATPRSSSASACRRPPTRARPASPASSTPPSRTPACRPRRCGRACPHYVAAAPNPKAVARARAQARVDRRRHRRRERAGDRRRRVRAPVTQAVSGDDDVRRSSSASSRPPTRRRRRPSSRTSRPATCSRASSSASSRSARRAMT